MSERTGVPPECKCGCGHSVAWNTHTAAWNLYSPGHYRRDAPYKNEAWLRAEYLQNDRSIRDIAAECGVSRHSVLRFVRKFGIEPLTSAESWVRRLRESGDQCEVCGGLMSSQNTLGVCTRNATCEAEYIRRHYQKYREDVLAGRRQPYVSTQRVPPFLYGIHFQASGILKIGTSTRLKGSLLSAKKWVRARGFDDRDGCQIWSRPGHHLGEIYVQANFSFHFPPTFQGTNRMSEWFNTGVTLSGEMIQRLDAIYDDMPPLPTWFTEDREVGLCPGSGTAS